MAFKYNICDQCMSYMVPHTELFGWLRCNTCRFSKKDKKAMISMPELLKDNKLEDQSQDIQDNLAELLKRSNMLRTEWGSPMIITSGLRTMAEHLAIYKAKGITDPSKIPMQSKHLYGQACDIADEGLVITQWLKDNPDILEKYDLYCENHNKNWVHIQIVKFGSYQPGGTRWFNP